MLVKKGLRIDFPLNREHKKVASSYFDNIQLFTQFKEIRLVLKSACSERAVLILKKKCEITHVLSPMKPINIFFQTGTEVRPIVLLQDFLR